MVRLSRVGVTVHNGSREELIIPGVFTGTAGVQRSGRPVTDPFVVAFRPDTHLLKKAEQLPKGTPALLSDVPHRVESCAKSTFNEGFVSLVLRIDDKPWSEHPAAVKLDDRTIFEISKFICGDAGEGPVYRGSTDLTAFFKAAGLGRFVCRGSRRVDWVSTCLSQCTQDEIISVILRLASPHEYPRNERLPYDALAGLNQILSVEPIAVRIISGCPLVERKAPTPVLEGAIVDAAIVAALQSFDAASAHESWQKALDRRFSDPRGAITMAKSLVEAVCKHILDDLEISYSPSDDLPKIFRIVAGSTNITHDFKREGALRQMLSGCASVVHGLATLRNALGDAHGGGRYASCPKDRDVELAINLAGSMATFLIKSYVEGEEGIGNN